MALAPFFELWQKWALATPTSLWAKNVLEIFVCRCVYVLLLKNYNFNVCLPLGSARLVLFLSFFLCCEAATAVGITSIYPLTCFN